MSTWIESMKKWRAGGGKGRAARGTPEYDQVAAIHKADNPGWTAKPPRKTTTREEKLAKLTKQLKALGLEVHPACVEGNELRPIERNEDMITRPRTPARTKPKPKQEEKELVRTADDLAAYLDPDEMPEDHPSLRPEDGDEMDQLIDLWADQHQDDLERAGAEKALTLPFVSDAVKARARDRLSDLSPRDIDALSDFPLMSGNGLFKKAMQKFMAQKLQKLKKAKHSKRTRRR
jgi:hypothetical protein